MRSDILFVKLVSSVVVGTALTLVAVFMSGGSALLAGPVLALALMFFARAAVARTRGRIRRIEKAVREFGEKELELVREVLKRLPYFEDVREIDILLRDRGVTDRQQRAAIAFAAVEARRRQIFEARLAAAKVTFEGGDGTSPEAAVVLKGSVTTPTAIDLAIMRWIEGRLGPRETSWQREGQEHLEREGRRLAVIAVRSKQTDESQRFYFDLSAALRGSSGRAPAAEGE